MKRIDLLGFSVNAAAIVIVIVSVVLAVSEYREPPPAGVSTLPVITRVVFTQTSSVVPTTHVAIVPTLPPVIDTLPPVETPSATITPTRPAACVALPWLAHSATQTPDPKLGTALPRATATPFLIAHSNDLDPSVLQQDKDHVIIFRCNGDWDEYWLAGSGADLSRIPLQAGDVIFSVTPPASLASPTASPQPTQ